MAKKRAGYQFFTSSDLATIQRNTNKNYHLENFVFIAKKTGFPSVLFQKLKEQRDRRGYNPSPQVTYEAYQDLMRHLANVTDVPEYNAVYGRL